MSSTTPPGGVLALLGRNAPFRRLFAATVVSLFGDWFAFVAVSGFVAETTGRPGAPSLVFAASVLPAFFLSPVAGLVADRVDRKRLMVAVDLLRVLPALGLLLALRWRSPSLAFACVALLAMLSAFFDPVAEASVPNLVAPEDLSLAQAALGGVWGSMLFVGAALGGLMTLAFGREASLWLNAATFLVSALLVSGIRQPLQQPRSPVPEPLGARLGEVWTRVRGEPLTRALLLTKIGVGLGNGTVGLLPAFATGTFAAGDAGVGMLLAARGLGALLGPLLGRAWVRGDGRRLLRGCGACVLLYGVAYLLLPLAPSLPLAGACVVLAHLGGGAQWMLSTYGLQVITPDRLRGRVLGVDFGLTTLVVGLSALAADAVSARLGLTRACWGLATASLLYGTGWLWATRRLWRSGEDPLGGGPSGPRL